MKIPVLRVATNILPRSLRQWLHARGGRKQALWPPLGWVRFGSHRRLTPVSRVFGIDRGKSICRYYIEDFLSRHSVEIQGSVLEIADDNYTIKYGGERVTRSDVLHLHEGNSKATIVSDLSRCGNIPSESFDCIIFTQTLQFIPDFPAAILTLGRILKPGGILLATFPGISQISRYDMDRWGDYWRFTTLSARRMFEEAFAISKIIVEAYGNVLSASAYLYGFAAEELSKRELDHRDPDYEVLIAVRAEKPKELT